MLILLILDWYFTPKFFSNFETYKWKLIVRQHLNISLCNCKYSIDVNNLFLFNYFKNIFTLISKENFYIDFFIEYINYKNNTNYYKIADNKAYSVMKELCYKHQSEFSKKMIIKNDLQKMYSEAAMKKLERLRNKALFDQDDSVEANKNENENEVFSNIQNFIKIITLYFKIIIKNILEFWKK